MPREVCKENLSILVVIYFCDLLHAIPRISLEHLDNSFRNKKNFPSDHVHDVSFHSLYKIVSNLVKKGPGSLSIKKIKLQFFHFFDEKLQLRSLYQYHLRVRRRASLFSACPSNQTEEFVNPRKENSAVYDFVQWRHQTVVFPGNYVPWHDWDLATTED